MILCGFPLNQPQQGINSAFVPTRATRELPSPRSDAAAAADRGYCGHLLQWMALLQLNPCVWFGGLDPGRYGSPPPPAFAFLIV